MSKLNALKIKSISKIGMHSDGDGLYLKVQPSTKHNSINKSWIFRWGAQGKNTMGLGSEKNIPLKEARELASAEAQAALDALKASAKAKLVAGTPLTAEEADTLVL